MTTLEKLFVQIFERKDRIIEQVQQQAESYTQQLASTLLIDGITPPTWLLNPGSNSRSSDPHELEKEEIISKLLLQPPRESIPYPSCGRSLYYPSAVTGGNGRLSNAMCMETYAPKEDPYISNGPSVTIDLHNNDLGCSLNCVSEQDDSVSSPQNETEARISSIYAAPDTSLARIQRSRSRKKARELRTNMKNAAKSCLNNENKTRVSFSGDFISKIDFHQVTQDNCSSKPDKCIDIGKPVLVAAEGEVYSGRITRSRNSSQQTSGIVSSKLGTSASCNPKEGGDALPRSAGDMTCGLDAPNKLLDVPASSQLLNDIIGETKPICSNEGALKTAVSSNIAAPRFTRSRSGSQKESTISANHQENAKLVVAYEPIDVPVAKQSVSSGIKLDFITSCTGSECLASRQPSLGDYAAKTSRTRKTQDTQRHSKVYCGRITRSRSSIQQFSGINNFPKLATSASCNPKEGRDALPHSVGGLMHGLEASNKFMDALKTSQLINDSSGETQPICSNEGVLKQVNSSNIAASQVTKSMSASLKESSIGANHQENAEILVGKEPTDALVSKKVSPSIKLDLVTSCSESEGLASRQPSNCCKEAKPKQLNFDEMGECDFNEICCPLAKKRKLDGLSENECCPSNEFASSMDHISTSTFVEQELPTANVLSSKLEASRTHSHGNFDKCAKDGTMNIGLDVNDNPLVEDIEHNSKVYLHDDIAVPCEGDLGHKGEESAAGVHIPLSKDTKSSFVSSLTKHGNNDSKDCLDMEGRMAEQDFGPSKSNDLEVDMNGKLSNVKPNSIEVNTWPQDQQRNVKGQSNYSNSRGFMLHIQRDAIHCDMEASKDDLHGIHESAPVLSSGEIHVSQSDGIQIFEKRVHGMMLDMPEGTESLQELQTAEATLTKADRDTNETAYAHEQSGATCILNLIENAADDSTFRLAENAGATDQSSNDDVPGSDYNNFERSLPEWVSHLESDNMPAYDAVLSPQTDDKTVVGSDEIMPVYEGFVIDEEVENERTENAEGEIDFDTLEILSNTITRTSILEQICKSASMQTSLSEFSSAFKHQTIPDLYGFMADGPLENMDPLSTVSLDEDSRKHLPVSDSDVPEVDSTFPKLQKFDLLPFSSTPFCWQSKSHYSFPVGKLWERSASSSGSSEMQLSSNPELTCFPIEEDPSNNDESENAEEMVDELQENTGSRAANDLVERQPPTKPTEVPFQHPITISTEMNISRKEIDDEVFEVQECIVSREETNLDENDIPPESTEACSQNLDPVSMSMKYYDRCSSNSINVELSFPETHDKINHKPKNHPGIKVSRCEVDNRTSSVSTRSRGNLSLQTEYGKNKSSMRNRIPRASQKEAKRNNIVSNITSFIPIVQQKQAAAAWTGKRDIKVKALEAAEAAKRREQEKENERKMKKEALKLERARIEKENLRELELNKKKKQEEQKKKEADMAARKRQREEDEKKQMAKKRKQIADTRKEQQKRQYEKSRGGKAEVEKQHGKNAIHAANKKGSDNATENQRRNQNADENSSRKQETTLANVVPPLTFVPENHDASNTCDNTVKATSMLEKSPAHDGSMGLANQEISYDISPYHHSDDDDDDDEDELPTKKFVPSWASKSHVATFLPLQQKLDPEKIFPVESFCSMDEVLLPRRLQAQ